MNLPIHRSFPEKINSLWNKLVKITEQGKSFPAGLMNRMVSRRSVDPNIRRVFDYNYDLLPNSYLAGIDAKTGNVGEAIEKLDYSVGFPAWNLLYYSLLCSIPPESGKIITVETGTSQGYSTIIMAQALKDSGKAGLVNTIDADENILHFARAHIQAAGLAEYVHFHTGDSLEFLRGFPKEEGLNFAFLDSGHHFEHVRDEFAIIHPAIVAAGGTVYFDNTTDGGVAEALKFIKENYGGNLVEFRNCSWSPPGNAIWQPG